MGQTQQAPPPQQQTTSDPNEGKSRQQIRDEYEKEYLKRTEEEKLAKEKAKQEIIAAEAKAQAQQTRGTLPKGFEAKSAETTTKPKGTLPKGF